MESIEVLFYWLVWTSSVLFAFYSFIIDSKYFSESMDSKDFTKGWLLDSRRDVSDYEWTAIRETFLKNFKYILVYLLLTQLIAKYKPKYLSLFFVIYSSIAIIVVLNLKSLLIVIFNILITLLIQSFGNQLLCYSLFGFTLYSVHNPFIFPIKSSLELNERQQFLFEVCMAWLNAKCLSLSVDRIRTQTHRTFQNNQLIQTIAYCLYLPAFFTGPIHQYNTFIIDINQIEPKWTLNRVIQITKQLIRYTFWTIVLELMLHIVYSSSVQFYPEISQILPIWPLCGLGFALPLMFFIKYFIIYGSVATIASIDGFQMPAPPKCIGHIHSCVYLWRTFDRGLHLWLTNYFYKPMIGTNWNPIRKVLAGFVCFSCICLWHGMDSAVIVWTSLNFFGVSAEIIANSIYSSNVWNFVKRNLSTDANLRLNALIASPFYAIAFISNLFFLSNWSVGYCFVERILFSFPVPLVPTLLIMYCGCNVSIHCIQRDIKCKQIM